MLTGKRLFQGETVSDTLAAVLRADIDWETLPAGPPAAIRRLLERCLERDQSGGCATSGKLTGVSGSWRRRWRVRPHVPVIEFASKE